MPVSTSIREQAGKFLERDEEIRHAFHADLVQSIQPSMQAKVVFVVSDRRILVVDTSFWTSRRLKSVRATFSRGTRLGPVGTEVTPSFLLSGLTYEIDDEDVATVEAVDAARASATGPDEQVSDR